MCPLMAQMLTATENKASLTTHKSNKETVFTSPQESYILCLCSFNNTKKAWGILSPCAELSKKFRLLQYILTLSIDTRVRVQTFSCKKGFCSPPKKRGAFLQICC